jgi:putative hydrolase of the HAD superfamily
MMPCDLCLLVTSEVLFKEVLNHTPSLSISEDFPTDIMIGQNICARLAAGKREEAVINESCCEGQEQTTFAYFDDRYAVLSSTLPSKAKKIWFNPEGKLAPEVDPAHDAEIRDLDEIPKLPELLNKPSLAQCLAWWEDWSLPENVRRHARVVSRIAYTLAVMMRNQGIEVDPILAHRGGLLHDLDKITTLHKTGKHGQEGADFLEEKGFPALAEIVREHLMHTILQPHADHRRWEVKLVYFSDKLVEGDQIVPFDQRLEALLARYPYYSDAMLRAKNPIMRLSNQICSILSVPGHEALVEMLKEMQTDLLKE